MPAPDPIDIDVGSRIRRRRLKLGMSQSDLGVRVGVSYQQIQKYESARNRLAASMLVAVADALHLAVTDLLPQVGWTSDDDTPGFVPDPESRALVIAWSRLGPDQRAQTLNLILGLAQKPPGHPHRRD